MSPYGVGRDCFWRHISRGCSATRTIRDFDASAFPCTVAAPVPPVPHGDDIVLERAGDGASRARPDPRRYSRASLIAVIAAREAWADAGTPEVEPTRLAVVLGSGIGGALTLLSQNEVLREKGPRRVSPHLIPMLMPNGPAATVGLEIGARAGVHTPVSACASGAEALALALEMLRDGRADVIVAGGAEAPLSPLTFGAFAIIKTMSQSTGDPAEACRPFDLARDGFVMGEGAASLVIEELEHARRRGAHIYAEVLGYSLNNDAFHMTTPLPSGDASVHAMRDALADAGIAPEQIDYVNAHASSTQLNDSTETGALKQVFGDHARKLMVSGTKAYTGHPLGATGAIETAICALAMDNAWVPPTLNRGNADPACDLDVVPNIGRTAELNYVMSNSFGFGGINACVVLGRVE